MKKQLLLFTVAIVVGLSSCNDETLPTEGQNDLLKNPSTSRLLEDSEYGTAFEDFYTEARGDTVYPVPHSEPISPSMPREPTVTQPPGSVHETDEATGNASKYKPAHSTHISSGINKSKYVPVGFEHIKEGIHQSKCYPTGAVHNRGKYDRTLYKPAGTEHIKAGANVTKYKPAGWVHISDSVSVDKSKYIPAGYQHIAKGPDESKYCKPTSTPAGQ